MPFNYCSLNDVQAELLGLDVSDMPATLMDRIQNDYMPLMKEEVDTYLGENLDLTFVTEWYDGNDLPTIVLRHKNINQVCNVVIRIVPSMQWFQFRRWYNIKTVDHTGIKIALDGGVEPINGTVLPPYIYPVGSGVVPTGRVPTANFIRSNAQYERSDLHIDNVNGVLIIPPRVLFIEAQGVPFWNYTWLKGQRNIQVDYWYGYADYAHLPSTIKHATAKLVAAHVLQKKAMWVSSGTKSISQDNVSKNFGDGAYSTEIKALREEAYKVLDRYKRIVV